MNTDILRNELMWLKSIGCSIIRKKSGIEVKSIYTSSTDFNFYIPINGEQQENVGCYRVPDSVCTQISWLKDMDIEKSHDINYIYFGNKGKTRSFGYNIIEVDFRTWNSAGELRREKVPFAHYFIVLVEGTQIGRFSTIEEKIIGIYDYEIKEEYRNKGIGSFILNSICNKYDTIIFIQTWSENLAAIKCL